MTRGERLRYFLLVGVWLSCLIYFWTWWLQEDHVFQISTFLISSLIIAWSTIIPGYFFYFVGRMSRFNPEIPNPNVKVAMVVTKAPSEPFSIVEKTLRAMLAQKYPHDTWLADEDPSGETRNWCEKHGVLLSTRKGVHGYHRHTWPRRTRSKEGNLAYFYDTYGYEKYDIVVQMDADHIPTGNYLEEMIRPFADPKVGYVSAPSICSANASGSWSARGRLHAEAIMHGPLQAGHSRNFAPLCIGSHYAMRTKALKEIGGVGPELAEDHSTTLMMNALGWRGIHAYDAFAVGDGPLTFADCMTQEFQWSRSLMIILCVWLPKYWRRLPLRLKLQFLFSELWYPLFSFTMLLGLSLPVAAILLRNPLVSVTYLDFLLHAIPVSAAILAIVAFLKHHRYLRPADAPMLSWESVLFVLARWPWSLYGSFAGLFYSIFKKVPHFRVTPKEKSESCIPYRVLTPYLAIIALSLIPVLIRTDAGNANGYFFFLFLNVFFYAILVSAVFILHRRESAK